MISADLLRAGGRANREFGKQRLIPADAPMAVIVGSIAPSRCTSIGGW